MTDSINQLAKLIRDRPATVLTGAGISVASGLPVYRDVNGNWVHSKPMDGPTFRSDITAQRRYWCRSFFGWPSFSRAQTNSVHNDIAALEQKGFLSTIITQNVDGLHQKAGSKNTVALHGNLSEVICLGCERISSRDELQRRLEAHNPDHAHLSVEQAPDGDALIDDSYISSFKLLACENCSGTLKPNVVFFGDNVPKARVQLCMNKLKQNKLLLCIGTSLMVYSGFRFCKAAQDAGIPIIIINDGRTRADDIASAKFGGECAVVMSSLRKQLL